MRALDDLFICLRFLSRLPIPATHREAQLGGGFAAAAAMVPLAGAVIGLVAALLLVAAAAMGLPPLPTAAITVATLVLVTGALHEDALADCADGFGGGRTREQILAIMRDSRIGAFGACAIGLSLLIRTAALEPIVDRRPLLAAACVVVAASVSRMACLMVLRLLPPARPDGLGAAAGRPSDVSLVLATAIAVAIGLVLLPLGVAPGRLAAAIGLAGAAAALVAAAAHRTIGGQTGDVVGTAQQLAECAILLVLAGA